MNHYILYQNKTLALYHEDCIPDWHGQNKAGECLKCGECEKICPQHIRIRDELARVHQALHG